MPSLWFSRRSFTSVILANSSKDVRSCLTKTDKSTTDSRALTLHHLYSMLVYHMISLLDYPLVTASILREIYSLASTIGTVSANVVLFRSMVKRFSTIPGRSSPYHSAIIAQADSKFGYEVLTDEDMFLDLVSTEVVKFDGAICSFNAVVIRSKILTISDSLVTILLAYSRVYGWRESLQTQVKSRRSKLTSTIGTKDARDARIIRIQYWYIPWGHCTHPLTTSPKALRACATSNYEATANANVIITRESTDAGRIFIWAPAQSKYLILWTCTHKENSCYIMTSYPPTLESSPSLRDSLTGGVMDATIVLGEYSSKNLKRRSPLAPELRSNYISSRAISKREDLSVFKGSTAASKWYLFIDNYTNGMRWDVDVGMVILVRLRRRRRFWRSEPGWYGALKLQSSCSTCSV
ncbi:uncharacterized protein BDR25DRAFT_349064 [Lindgomyces ingoldianus]|uniref:Uncharacterized protein n=1 Tax=Lindgomyces ingoldianus TaxID=673940 RepID=A0ACB6RFS0_9PLEO|nr:uncharacterized protein BDR25DRAFT_349064 [Lindgomyces ingoldianus]KAF2477170.1 hypothetical protein BDR25DRAFT_349064 [Lindgomyces ingoldianus]